MKSRFFLFSFLFHAVLLLLIIGIFKQKTPALNFSVAQSVNTPVIEASMVTAVQPVQKPTEPSREKPELKPILAKPESVPVEKAVKPIPPKLKPKKEEAKSKPKPKVEKNLTKVPPKKKPLPKETSPTDNHAAEKQKALAAIKSATAEAKAAAEQRALTLEEKYMGLIQASIRSQWINQFDPLADLEVTLQIELDAKGNVQSVEIAHSSGNVAFDRQAIAAVQKASPLPIPDDPLIAKDFADITLPFRNQAI